MCATRTSTWSRFPSRPEVPEIKRGLSLIAAREWPLLPVDADEAGLGGGLDQAEEAQLGITDEELLKKRKP